MEFVWDYEVSQNNWFHYKQEISEKLNSGEVVEIEVEESKLSIDPLQMKQINANTGFRRNIRCTVSSGDDLIVWEYLKGRKYTPLPMNAQLALEQAHKGGDDRCKVDFEGQQWEAQFDSDGMRMKSDENECKLRRTISSAADSMGANPAPPATRSRTLTKRPVVDVSITRDVIKKEEEEEEEETAKSSKRRQSNDDGARPSTKSTKSVPKSTKRVMIMKGRAPVDPECEEKTKVAHVLEEGDAIWDAMLNQTNVGNNNNKYYILQLLEDDDKRGYSVWLRWGRVGYRGQMNLQKFGGDLDAAKRCFCKKFSDKTRNEWADRQNFEPSPGKYTLIQVDYSGIAAQLDKVNKEEADDEQPQDESKLDQRIQDLLGLICNLQAMEETVMEMEYDSARAPLGKLTPTQINEGYRLLSEIEEFIKSSTFGKAFVQTVNQYYTKIPHSFGMRQPPLIKTKEELQKEMELLDVLEDIEIAMRNLSTGKEKGDKRATVDRYYDNMKCKLEPLDSDHDEYKMVKQYLTKTHGSTHMYKIKLCNVFVVARENEEQKFHADIGNRMLLWHGSRLTNYFGILSQGLRIAPPEAPSCGYMFGKGVYFADMASKSGNYCYPQNGKPGLLLLSEVALGTSNVLKDADYNADKLPVGKQSTMGWGKTRPDEAEYITLEDGVVVPCGKPVKRNDGPTSLLYNEFIVYNTDQIKMRYLVEVEFKL